jgi:hypothetical protein
MPVQCWVKNQGDLPGRADERKTSWRQIGQAGKVCMQFRQSEHAASLDLPAHRAVFGSIIFPDRDALKFSRQTADVYFPAWLKAGHPVHTVCMSDNFNQRPNTAEWISLERCRLR